MIRTKSVLAGAALGLAGYFACRALLRSSRRIELRARTAIVTGGSRGLGLAIARQLVALGVKVAICARTGEDLETALTELQGGHGEVMALQVDVADANSAADMVKSVEARFGKVDLLFNVAGIMMVGPLEEMKLEDFQEAMAVNCFGALHTTLAVLPGMRARKFGRIVNVASIGGKIAVPHMAPYDASKFALVGLSKALRAELQKDGVLVTTACPTLMRTGSPRNADFKGRHRAEYAWFSAGGTLPFLSFDANAAAEQIISASQYGDAECFISNWLNPPVLAAVLTPQWTQEIMSIVNRFLPAPGGIGQRSAKGYESESAALPRWLVESQHRDAATYNQLRTKTA